MYGEGIFTDKQPTHALVPKHAQSMDESITTATKVQSSAILCNYHSYGS